MSKKKKPNIDLIEGYDNILMIDDVRSIERGLIARDFDTAIRVLGNMPRFDCVYLDFNYRNEASINPKTGYDILLWLEENPEKAPRHVKLITSNNRGRMEMRTILDRLEKRGLLEGHS